MKTFTHLLQSFGFVDCAVCFANVHFLKEESYRNQVVQDFEQKTGTSSWRFICDLW